MAAIIAEAIMLFVLYFLWKMDCKEIRIAGVIFFLLYFVCVFILTIGIREYADDVKANYIPLQSVIKLIEHFINNIRIQGLQGLCREYRYLEQGIHNLLGNILLLFPLGYLIPILFEKRYRWWNVGLFGCVISLLIEIAQFIMHLGYFDVDDVFLNTTGCLLGFVVHKHLFIRKSLIDA